jgi:MFS family permease
VKNQGDNWKFCSGVIGGTHDRTFVVAAGALLWSVCTIGVSMSSSLAQACFFSAANGIGLALVIPCAQSLMADLYPAEQRGRAFGAMQLTMSFGSMLGSLFATNVASVRVRCSATSATPLQQINLLCTHCLSMRPCVHHQAERSLFLILIFWCSDVAQIGHFCAPVMHPMRWITVCN